MQPLLMLTQMLKNIESEKRTFSAKSEGAIKIISFLCSLSARFLVYFRFYALVSRKAAEGRGKEGC